jgi:hypothetical protein
MHPSRQRDAAATSLADRLARGGGDFDIPFDEHMRRTSRSAGNPPQELDARPASVD